MKIRAIHLRKKYGENPTSLLFMGDDSFSQDNALICGNSGSGKTLICEAISLAWSRSVLGSDLDTSLDYDMIRIDFDLGNEIASVHISSGRVQGVRSIGRLSSVSSSELFHGLMYYGVNRCNYVQHDVSQSLPLSLRNVTPILADLHLRDVRDSVILIDHWDLGLDSSTRAKFYKYLVRHTRSRGNQLILTGYDVPDYIPVGNVKSINGQQDLIGESLALIGKMEL